MNQSLYKITNFIDKIINFLTTKILSKKELSRIIKISGKNNNPSGLEEWYNKWSVLGSPNKDYYRIFSKYIGEDINIVPDNLCHNIISPILNPKRYISTYADKNLFDRFIIRPDHSTLTPHTLLRCINGALFSPTFTPISSNQNLNELLKEENAIIIKPSIDGSSGKGVLFFDKIQEKWIEKKSKQLLSLNLIYEECGNNFIMQRVMEQSPFMSSLGRTSVNTLRIAVYRSVIDNKCHALKSIIRIGKEGSLVDNAHAGGVFVGVDNNGKVGNYCCNQYGSIITSFNGVDFKSNSLRVPNFEKIKDFAEEVASYIPHLRLLALDIMLNKDDNPILIEYNVKAFSPWLFQFTSGCAFGEYTDEIIEYCRIHKKEATRIFISF